jgi:hypothetical protein
MPRLSKKTRRNLATFNHLKYNTSDVVYSSKRQVNPLDAYIKAYKEIHNDTSDGTIREVA